MEIRIGTSGYSFDDWRGTYYPVDIDKGKMLDYYVKEFSTVEINSTYYRIPHPAVMYNIVKKAPDGFDFMVKVPQSFTHKRHDLEKDIADYTECLKPMIDSGKLTGLLAQFPYSFKYTKASLDYIAMIRDAVAPIPLHVEFRHASWVNREMYNRLRAEKIGYVCVDEPQLSGLLEPHLFNTTETGYIRLHGRNADQWWDGGALRYDYTYSKEELEEWRQKIAKLKAKGEVKKLYIYFNNCHLGQAIPNARDMQELIKGL